MWKHNEEAIAAVEDFNEKVCETLDSEESFCGDHLMTMATTGSETMITFMGIRLWCSEDDPREFNETTQEYEPLLEFLEREAKKHLELFSRVLAPKTEEAKPLEAGDFVHYFLESDFGNSYDNGRIKCIDESNASVVYKCDDNWGGYINYTGHKTTLSRLKPGWVDKYGKPIDTPKIQDNDRQGN